MNHRIGELTQRRGEHGRVSGATRQAIERWFVARWPHRHAITASDFDVPGGGASSTMLSFELSWEERGGRGGGRFILRQEPIDDPVAPRETGSFPSCVETEYRVQHALARYSRCPIAPLVGLETSPGVLGRPFYVMGLVEGDVPPTQGPNAGGFVVQLGPSQRRRLVESGLDALVAVHRVDWRAASLGRIGPSDGVSSLVARYGELARRHLRGAAHPALDRALAWLSEHAPANRESVLTWGDARPGNIVFGADGRVLAALDWELAAILPAGTDVALWLLADHMVHEVEGVARLPGYPTRDEQLAYYERRVGHPVADLHYWEMFSAMKIAYVIVRVVRRMQDAGQIPDGDDTMIHDNFAVRHLEAHLGHAASALVGVRS